MKTSKILASVSALAIVASMAIPAAAGNGAPIGIPENWTLDSKKTLATRTLIGKEEDGSLMDNTPENWEKLYDITTIRVTIQGDYFGEEDWAADGSVVMNTNYWSWIQADWNIGNGIYNTKDDGSKEINTEKNENISKIYVDGNKYTIEINGAQFCAAAGFDFTSDKIFEYMKKASEEESWDLSQDFLSINVQSFNEDTTKSWNILGYAFVDGNGENVITEGEVTMGDVYYADGTYADDSGNSGGDSKTDGDSKSDSDSKTDDKTSSKTDTKSTTTGGSTSTTTKSGSTGTTSTSKDSTADTGVTAGLALAGIALAGAAFVVSKKK